MPIRKANESKRVLVVSPPYRLSQSGFPLGLMYVAAALQAAGHHVEVIDMDVLNLPMDDYVHELKEREYDYFCIGGMITAWNFVTFSAGLVKQLKPHVPVIVGGGIISSTSQSLLSVTNVDVGVIGEGEEAVLDVIEAHESGRPFSSVPGIVCREDGKIVETARRTYIQDLDQLPYPAWDLFDIKNTYCRFPSNHSVLRAQRQASIYTTRGCPFQCTFCYTEKAVRQHSIDHVIQQLFELKRRYNVRHISIADDLFVVRKKRTIEFCEAMIKHKVNLTWSATGRCNIIEPEFLRIMKAAGCVFMGLGLESGSLDVLRKIKKSQTPEQIVQAVKMVKEAGITPGGTFIMGLPPETPDTVRETVETYKEINKYRTHVNRFFFATPYPGTELYTQMVQKGRIGDEIKYFEKISERGDAVDFCVNCTDAFTDEQLIRVKAEVEAEVFADFIKKHPWSAFCQHLAERTKWSKLQNLAITLKMRGFVDGLKFLRDKILVKLKLKRDQHKRQWNTKKKYYWQETMFEEKMPTF